MRILQEIIRDHLRYRKQILKLAKSDLIKTYKGAALGWGWAIIRPAITIAVYYFAFSVGLRAGAPVNGYPYFLWLIAGILPWFYVSAMWSGGAGCIRKYGYLVTKIRFPVSTIPTFYSLSQLTSNLALTVIVLLIFLIYGYSPTLYWLQIPFYMIIMVVFFTIWSLFAGMISVISKDFMQLVQACSLALFWLSGIMYNVGKIQNATLVRVMLWNPITLITTGYRDALIDQIWFWEKPFVLRNLGIAMVILTTLALWTYKKLIKSIPDVL